MPTVIGLIFFAASVYFFFQKDDELFALLIISALFQAASIIALDQAGIEPYYAVASMFIAQSIYRGKIGTAASESFKGKRWMIGFVIIAISSAFILPFVFAGIPVYDQRLGIDAGLLVRPPLQFKHSNISHSVFLLVDVLVVMGAAQRFRSGAFTKRAYIFAFYLLAGIVGLQYLCSVLGIGFPYALLQNNAGSSIQTTDALGRVPGTFTESSTAGQVLAAFTAGFIAQKLRFGRSLIPALIGLCAILLVRSSGSMVAIGVTIVLLLMSEPIFRFPYINMVRLTRVALFIGIISAVLTVVMFSPLRDSVLFLTVSKSETSSFVNRTASDLYALELLRSTHGVGVGMGSNRPSSLITSLLSTVGVVGCFAFLIAYTRLLSNALPKHPEVWWAGLAYLLSLMASGPDYDAPWIWVFLAVAVQAGRTSNSERSSFTPLAEP